MTSNSASRLPCQTDGFVVTDAGATQLPRLPYHWAPVATGGKRGFALVLVLGDSIYQDVSRGVQS